MSDRKHREELENQLDFMREQLIDTRKKLDGMAVIYTATNTQGEKVPKRNPAYDVYTELLRAYCFALRELREMVGDEQPARDNLVKFERFAKTMRKQA